MLLPTSSILTTWPPTEQSKIIPQLAENLKKFDKLHHRCYALVTSPLIGAHERATIGLLQDKFLTTDIQFLPMHNSRECVECMENIAKVTCKPLLEVVQRRMEALETQLGSEEGVMAVLSGFGFCEREMVMVMDGCGGLAGLARASEGDLRDLNLEHGTIRKIMDIFHT